MIPRNDEGEMAILGAILIDPECIRVLNLEPSDFFLSEHQLIYTAMLKCETPNEITVPHELNKMGKLDEAGGVNYIVGLVARAVTSVGVESYARVVKDCSINRRIISAAEQISSMASLNVDPKDNLLKANQIMSTIGRSVLTDNLITPEKLALMGADRYATLSHGIKTSIKTGIEQLDYETGGLFQGEMWLLGGRAGQGKTSLAMQISEHMQTQGNILFASLEMNWRGLLDRRVATELAVHPRSIRIGNYSDDFYKDIVNALPKIADTNLYFLGRGLNVGTGITTDMLFKIAETMKLTHGLSAIVVDYLQLLADGGKNPYEKISTISTKMKQLLEALEVPGLVLSQLSRSVEDQHNKSKRPNLTSFRECVTGDTTVLTYSGKHAPISTLSDMVLTYDYNTNIYNPAKASVIESGEKEVFKVTTSLGHNIKCTGNHRFLTPLGFKELSSLSIGNYVAIPSAIPNYPKYEDVNPDLARIMGYLLGDGGLTMNTAITWTEVDQVVIDDMLRLMGKCFPTIIPKDKWYNNAHQLTFSQVRRGNNCNNLLNWLRNMGIRHQYSHHRQIPDRFYLSNNDVLRNLLIGLFTSDGCIKYDTRRANIGYRIHFDTNSEILCKQVHIMLLKFGIVSHSHSDNGIYRKFNQVKQRHPMHRLMIDTNSSLHKFVQEIGFVGHKAELCEGISPKNSRGASEMLPPEVTKYIYDESRRKKISWSKLGYEVQTRQKNSVNDGSKYKGIHKNRAIEVAKVLQDDSLNKIATSDLSWVRIIGIEPIGTEMTYDLSVEKYHNYIANGLIVHNSGKIEEDADVALLMFRPDKYPELLLENPELRGTAELILAKNRQGDSDISIPLAWDNDRRVYV